MTALQPYFPLQTNARALKSQNSDFRLDLYKESKTSNIERLGLIGSSTAILAGLGLLMSPLLTKKAVPITSLLIKLPGLSTRQFWLEQFMSQQKKLKPFFGEFRLLQDSLQA